MVYSILSRNSEQRAGGRVACKFRSLLRFIWDEIKIPQESDSICCMSESISILLVERGSKQSPMEDSHLFCFLRCRESGRLTQGHLH
ncbi:hypothetical protein CIPAW_11G064800 [Carya illinoinensis]|uniref:Uncharacterized protein n=1 Tax=Carya illinoinensis TaxID=32201 RepID=A0A8T1P0F6_CARIL|nr:hypothetical protein CIPAW_11G064800 [Carya illinoinensis]